MIKHYFIIILLSSMIIILGYKKLNAGGDNLENTKKLTEASLLSSLFIIITLVLLGSGFGYALYLDFVVPIFFCIILLKCDIKYSILSGITSLFIIGIVFGDIGTSIWITQSIILGILCGVLISKKGTILDDILIGTILGIIIMVFIDIYASNLIGYSFIKEFQGYAKAFKYKDFSVVIYYIFIGIYPMGTIFSIYILSLLFTNKLNIAKNKTKTKVNIINNFKFCLRFICLSKNVFYASFIYIFLVEIINLLNFNISGVYLKTIIISIEYICFYFIIRDSYTLIQNYIILNYKRGVYIKIVTIILLFMLIIMFKLSTLILILITLILDKKQNIRLRQFIIINNYIHR